MLNSLLIVGLPMVALLSAAFYVFWRTPQFEQGQSSACGRPRKPDRKSGVRKDQPGSTIPRHRRHVHAGNGDDNIDDDSRLAGDDDIDDDNHLASSLSDPPDLGFVYKEEQCEICFEDREKVYLYPCKHSDICRECAIKLLMRCERNLKCPFCRCSIEGYMEMNGSTEVLG